MYKVAGEREDWGKGGTGRARRRRRGDGMPAEDNASADVAAWGGQGGRRATAVNVATERPRLCLRGHGDTGRLHGMSPWMWPRGRLRKMSLRLRL